MKLVVCIFFLCSSSFAMAQGYGRQKKDCFPQSPRYEKSHWYFGPGLTYTIAPLGSKTVVGTTDADTLYRTNLNRSGQLGFYGELGRYFLIEKLYFFRYWNVGMNYRWIKGKEQYSDERVVLETPTNIGSGENSFSDHFLNLHLEINGINRLSDETFLQHTLGVGAGYGIVSKRAYNHLVPGIEQKTGSKMHSYLYYRLGWGIKSNSKLIIIPSIEIPVLNIYSFHGGRPDMPYFNSGFWPITFSVRFFLFRKYRLKNCKPVDSIGLPEGFDPDEPSKK